MAQASETSGAASRGRRRGPRPAGTDTRAAILDAAGHEFAAHGYDGTSLRAVARRAHVDAALVHHYFADKAELFAESLQAPIRPDRVLATVLAGPRDEAGANLVRALLTALDEPGARDRMITILRTALGTEFVATMVRQFISRELVARLGATMDGPDAALRATLVATQVVGLLVVRYGVRVEPLATAPVDDIVALAGPTIQRYLDGTAS